MKTKTLIRMKVYAGILLALMCISMTTLSFSFADLTLAELYIRATPDDRLSFLLWLSIAMLCIFVVLETVYFLGLKDEEE